MAGENRAGARFLLNILTPRVIRNVKAFLKTNGLNKTPYNIETALMIYKSDNPKFGKVLDASGYQNDTMAYANKLLPKI